MSLDADPREWRRIITEIKPLVSYMSVKYACSRSNASMWHNIASIPRSSGRMFAALVDPPAFPPIASPRGLSCLSFELILLLSRVHRSLLVLLPDRKRGAYSWDDVNTLELWRMLQSRLLFLCRQGLLLLLLVCVLGQVRATFDEGLFTFRFNERNGFCAVCCVSLFQE